MIWQSVVTMTIIDVIVILLTLGSSVLLFRNRQLLSQLGGLFPAAIIIGALATLALMYLYDFATMHLFPIFLGTERSMALMREFHLGYIWIGIVIVSLLLFLGIFLLISRFAQLHKQHLRQNEQQTRLVDELKQAKAVTTTSHELLTDAIEALSDGFVLFDANDRLVLCNSKYRELHPIVADKMVPGATVEDIIRIAVKRGQHPEAAGREEEWIQQRLVAFRNPTVSVEQQLKSGGWLRVYERKTVDGATVGIRTDITTLKEREHALRESEERFKDFASASSDYFWEMDRELRFSFFSDRFTDVTGVSSDWLLGKTRQVSEIENRADPNAYRQHLKDLAAHRPFRNFVHSRERSEGELVYLSISGVPVFDEDGKFCGYRGIGTDITVQKRAEKRRDEALAETERANRAKSQFLANMSHELRTPLNAISGFSQMLTGELFGPLGSPKYKEYADDISASSNHLLSLVNDILDLSAIEAGKYPLVKESLIVHEIIDDCRRFIATAADLKGITYSVEISADVQPLFADRRALKQILLNVLSNAVKFTAENGHVTLKATASNCHHVFEICDTGEGVLADRVQRLTEPFIRSDPDPHKSQEGTGLGLAIVKLLVDLHEGELTIESEVEIGTIVTVAIPSKTPQLSRAIQ